MGIDVFRGTDGVLDLPKTVSSEIWKKTEALSVVQSLSPQISLPAGGIDIPIITGAPEAEWVGETEEAKVSRPTFSNKTIRGYKMSVTVPFSNEFRRDQDALYRGVLEQLPGSISRKFDRTALGFLAAPGSNFDTLEAAPELAAGTDYDSWLDALELVGAANDDADIEAWALSKSGEIAAMRAKDGDGNALLVRDAIDHGSIGSILARPTLKSAHAGDSNVLGIAGKWSNTAWGAVENISMRMTTDATINDNGTQINLFQRDMFALKVNFEVGFAVRDPKEFVRIVRTADGVVTP